MESKNQQIKLSEDLIKFFKRLKKMSSYKLKLIELVIANVKPLNEILLIPSNKQIENQEQFDYLKPICIVKGVKKKIFQRFFLRVNQFFQYRLYDLRNIKNGMFKSEVTKFHKSLDAIYLEITQQLALQHYFKQITRAQNIFIQQLLCKINKNSVKLMIHKKIIDQLQKNLIIKQTRRVFPAITKIRAKTPSLKCVIPKTVIGRISQQNNCNKLKKTQNRMLISEINKRDFEQQCVFKTIFPLGKSQFKKNQDKLKMKKKLNFKAYPISQSDFGQRKLINGTTNPQIESSNKKDSYFKLISQLMDLESSMKFYSYENLFNNLHQINKSKQAQILKYNKKWKKKLNILQNRATNESESSREIKLPQISIFPQLRKSKGEFFSSTAI